MADLRKRFCCGGLSVWPGATAWQCSRDHCRGLWHFVILGVCFSCTSPSLHTMHLAPAPRSDSYSLQFCDTHPPQPICFNVASQNYCGLGEGTQAALTLQVNSPRWVNSIAGHRGASSFQQSGQAHRLIARRRREGGVSFSRLVRIRLIHCSAAEEAGDCGVRVARAGDA